MNSSVSGCSRPVSRLNTLNDRFSFLASLAAKSTSTTSSAPLNEIVRLPKCDSASAMMSEGCALASRSAVASICVASNALVVVVMGLLQRTVRGPGWLAEGKCYYFSQDYPHRP